MSIQLFKRSIVVVAMVFCFFSLTSHAQTGFGIYQGVPGVAAQTIHLAEMTKAERKAKRKEKRAERKEKRQAKREELKAKRKAKRQERKAKHQENRTERKAKRQDTQADRKAKRAAQ